MSSDDKKLPTSSLESNFKEAYKLQQVSNNERLEKKIEEATLNGKEEFDANKVFELYYPNDWSNDEALILKRAQSFKDNYYNSNAKSIQEWVDNKETIEQQGDS